MKLNFKCPGCGKRVAKTEYGIFEKEKPNAIHGKVQKLLGGCFSSWVSHKCKYKEA